MKYFYQLSYYQLSYYLQCVCLTEVWHFSCVWSCRRRQIKCNKVWRSSGVLPCSQRQMWQVCVTPCASVRPCLRMKALECDTKNNRSHVRYTGSLSIFHILLTLFSHLYILSFSTFYRSLRAVPLKLGSLYTLRHSAISFTLTPGTSCYCA